MLTPFLQPLPICVFCDSFTFPSFDHLMYVYDELLSFTSLCPLSSCWCPSSHHLSYSCLRCVPLSLNGVGWMNMGGASLLKLGQCVSATLLEKGAPLPAAPVHCQCTSGGVGAQEPWALPGWDVDRHSLVFLVPLWVWVQYCNCCAIASRSLAPNLSNPNVHCSLPGWGGSIHVPFRNRHNADFKSQPT